MSLKNPVTPPGIDAGTVRLVAQRLNHYATPGPKILLKINLKFTLEQVMKAQMGSRCMAVRFL